MLRIAVIGLLLFEGVHKGQVCGKALDEVEIYFQALSNLWLENSSHVQIVISI